MSDSEAVVGLGPLADPELFTGPVQLGDRTADEAVSLLSSMVKIRLAEELIGTGVSDGVVKCPCHLAIGQEAAAVGVAYALRRTDHVFGTHRSHSHFLAQGGTSRSLFAEILGKETGCSRGMGGSMHLHDASVGFVGSVPIVGATVPMAVGAGLAAQMAGHGDVGVAFLGDGAMEEGAVHESLNFAAQFQLPVLFVVENNMFSSHLHIRERQPSDSVARFAVAHGIDHEVVDGNDVVAVSSAAVRLVEAARRGEGPGFIEAVTYRWRGHVGASEDTDVGVMRKQDLGQWKRRDPVTRLATTLVEMGTLSSTGLAEMSSKIAAELQGDWAQAEADPFPPETALLSRVYSTGRPVR